MKGIVRNIFYSPTTSLALACNMTRLARCVTEKEGLFFVSYVGVGNENVVSFPHYFFFSSSSCNAVRCLLVRVEVSVLLVSGLTQL